MRKPATGRDACLRGTLSIRAFAVRHGLSPSEVRRLLATGRLPFVQIRGEIRVPRSAVPEAPV